MAANTDDEDDLTTYTLTGTSLSPRRMRIETDDADFVIGDDASPVEYLLGSLLACVNSTGALVARDMGIDLEELTGTIEGTVDYAAFLGEETDARAGYQQVTISLTVDADADDETLEAWLAAVEQRCPVSDNVENGTPLGFEFERV